MAAQGRGGGKTPEKLVNLLKKKVANSSQSAVARETGLTQSAIGRYIKGIGEPSSETLQILADYFGVHVAWLRGEFDSQNLSYEKAVEYKKAADSDKSSGWVGDVAMDDVDKELAKYLLGLLRKEMPDATDEEISDFVKTAKITIQGNKITWTPPRNKQNK